ncbi:ATP-grasp domain-containing protein [Paenibacillus dendritiformis]|uniref:ATP-grasp domain-containing protein n=1 Tax=Paenibacillus dendritiformis TaxID=130049 RepID=UPI00248B17EC|nr:ATP-grasp domain-containing protein [Paenibacillus dendritiformis]WGU93755.1 ATP-grasp domain-containing protein [Paenibacillus dendritiformis]
MKILAVGAGREQACIIKQAKDMGLYVVAIDGKKDSPGFKYADKSYIIDISNENEVIKIANKEKITAVLPTPIGRFLTTVGAVNDYLGLKGISKKAAIICTDKIRANEVLLEHGIYSAKQFHPTSEESIVKLLEKVEYPLIIKPRYGAGSKGVRVVNNSEELLLHYSNGILIEELMKGKEYGLDGIVRDGVFHIVLVREKVLTELPYRQEIGYISPAPISMETLEKIKNSAQKVCDAVGLTDCLFNADILIEDDAIKWIEFSGRPAGLNISQFIVPYVTGENYITHQIKYLIQKNNHLIMNSVENYRKMYLGFFSFTQTGYVTSVPRREEIIENDNVLEYQCLIKEGDFLDVIRDGGDLINRGHFAITGQSVKEMLATAQSILNKFCIKKER